MEVRWHELTVICDHDGVKLTLIAVWANALGEFQFHYQCPKCGQDYHSYSDWCQILERCLVSDETERKKVN